VVVLTLLAAACGHTMEEWFRDELEVEEVENGAEEE
jgi:hypothetical protein